MNYDDESVMAKEYSSRAEQGDEPCYSVNTPRDRELLRDYRDRANAERQVLFGGRLGSYRYLDMDMAIGSALRLVETRLSRVYGGQQG